MRTSRLPVHAQTVAGRRAGRGLARPLPVALAVALAAVARGHFRRRERTNARGEQVLAPSGSGGAGD